MISSTQFADPDDVLGAARGFLARGQRGALATVVTTWGSSPRPVGSLLAVAEGGAFVGSVSGGCVEGAVVSEANEIIKGAPAKLLQFGITNEEAWDVGLACGGKVEIFVASLTGSDAALKKIADAQATSRGAVLATDLASGAITALIESEIGDEPLGIAALARSTTTRAEPLRLAAAKFFSTCSHSRAAWR